MPLCKVAMDILLPNRIRRKVQKDDETYANITHLSGNISAYYTLSPCFFPDYTIHGIDHVNAVLDLADHLIPGKTMTRLSTREIAILTAAIMVHDIGMFITEDGLARILTGDHAGNLVPGLDSQPWRAVWADYCQKIKRCTDRELFRAFGDKEPIESICTVQNEMRRKDYLVCGEFIRRQHHRLAHEIALHGFVGSTDVDIFRNTTFIQEEKNLIGLLARSHGMSIRGTESYLKSISSELTQPLNIHLAYLMAILRIADYLDVGQHRAPKALQDQQEINAPISQGEWIWNRIIRHESHFWDYEHRRLVIHAKPETTSLFAKTEKWLHGLQRELDLSWAIIMEYYPRENIELSIHRIESNVLTETTRAAMNQQFLIKETTLAANPDLLKLLIRPLYGDDPSFGVRELLQNSVDACTERKHLEQDENYRGKVTISIDSKNKTITIVDNGVGMNEDVLRNYYLSAGSSYRYSDNWMADFAQGRETQIARSGRFGVGVLSIFLLGASVHVETRHLKDTLGYAFDFSMEQESIDMRRIECDVGTTQVVKLSNAALAGLKKAGDDSKKEKWYEWYAFKEPEVRYYVDKSEINPLESRTLVPQTDNEDPKWFSYNSPNYESFQWQYWPYNDFAEAYCNGILIKSINEHELGADTGMRVEVPCISIVDRMALLPINLERSTILEFPDKNGIISEIYRYLLAKLLLTKWNSDEVIRDHLRSGFYPGSYGMRAPSYVFSKQGFTLNRATFLAAAGIRQLLEFGYYYNVPLRDFYDMQTTIPISFFSFSNSSAGREMYWDFMNKNSFSTDIVPCRIWGKEPEFASAKEQLPKYFSAGYQEQPTCSGYCRYDREGVAEPAPSFVEDHLDANVFPVVAEYKIDPEKRYAVPDEKNIMLKLLRDYLGEDIWIPIAMEERKKKFPKAFEELRYYMNRLKN